MLRFAISEAGQANPTSCALPSQASRGNNGSVAGYYDQDNANSSIGHTAAYGYDALNRLSSATVAPLVTGGPESYSQTYTYDQFGNVDCWGSGTCASPSYNSATNQVSSWGGVAATYDAAGNMTSDGTGVGGGGRETGDGRVRTEN